MADAVDHGEGAALHHQECVPLWHQDRRRAAGHRHGEGAAQQRDHIPAGGSLFREVDLRGGVCAESELQVNDRSLSFPGVLLWICPSFAKLFIFGGRFTSAVLRGDGWQIPLPPFGQGWWVTPFDSSFLDPCSASQTVSTEFLALSPPCQSHSSWERQWRDWENLSPVFCDLMRMLGWILDPVHLNRTEITQKDEEITWKFRWLVRDLARRLAHQFWRVGLPGDPVQLGAVDQSCGSWQEDEACCEWIWYFIHSVYCKCWGTESASNTNVHELSKFGGSNWMIPEDFFHTRQEK